MTKKRVLAKKTMGKSKSKKKVQKIEEEEMDQSEDDNEIVSQDQERKDSENSDDEGGDDGGDDDEMNDDDNNEMNDDITEMNDESKEEVTDNRKRKRTTIDQVPAKKIKKGKQAHLVIGGLRDETTAGSVKSFFKRRNIDVTEIIKVPAKKLMYLTFENTEQQLKALKAQNKRIHGSKIKLEKIKHLPSSSELSQAGEPNKELLVRNLSFDTGEDKLKSLFKGCKSVRLLYYHDSQRPRGLAIVEYEQIEEADAGMKEVNETEVDGRTIYVCYALKREKKKKKKKTKKNDHKQSIQMKRIKALRN